MSPAIVKVNYVAMSAGGRAAAGASADYYAHRPDSDGEREYRPGFDVETEELDKNEVYSRIEQGEGDYVYRIILSPGEEEMDAADVREWARDVMEPVEEAGGEWVGFVHDDQTDHPHAHVIAFTDEKLDRGDLAEMREIGTEGAEIFAEANKSWLEKVGEEARDLAEEAGAEAKNLASDMSTHGVIGAAEGAGEEIKDLASDAEYAGARIAALVPGGEREPDPERDRAEEDAREMEIQDWMDQLKSESDELMGIKDPMESEIKEDLEDGEDEGHEKREPEIDRRELMALEHEDPSPEAQPEP
ncbi:relaxase/mobilization nuclease domain-containing protein [Rubrobacter aplysinae]|uniref:relaxase/mobilization nuclease domain-containing protein n=1 Tax=Rubrobacter aplysinae TaxID=909625 RepID=UPI00064C34DB|nr:relaxase/mobilization nuclease domain-containing protein [Rubrobacter aplysinae]